MKTDKLAAIGSLSLIISIRTVQKIIVWDSLLQLMKSWRGHCSFVQYIANKPAKYGLKIYILCDAKTFYTSRMEVYCRKQPEGQYQLSNKPFNTVHRLVEDIVGSNQILTIDNWYTSYPLVTSLLEKKLCTLGL